MRLEAILRILLTQPHVVVSSRPQFEDRLATFTGCVNARYARLEPLLPTSVQDFVREALKVRVLMGIRCSLPTGLRTQNDARGRINVEKRMARLVRATRAHAYARADVGE